MALKQWLPIVVLVAGCGSSGEDAVPERSPAAVPPATAADSAESLPPLALPDLSAAAPEVQQQIRDEFAALTVAIDDPDTSAADRGRAYGAMGRLLMASEYSEAARDSFLHARALLPRDPSWRYYLGHLSRLQADLPAATRYFEETLQRSPDDVPTKVWLGDVYLTQNRLAEAERVLTEVLVSNPQSVAALYRLGRVAAARGDHARAVELFEAGLSLDPGATSFHYPLGLAYRELGEQEQAAVHLQARQSGVADVLPPDPLMEAVGGILEGAQAFQIRAGQAMDQGDWAQAVADLAQAVEIDPNDAVSRLNLGTSLYMTGEREGARAQYDAAVDLDANLAAAHYAIGILLEEEGRDADALERFALATDRDPGDAPMRLRFADALRRTGRLEEAIARYAEVLEADAGLSAAAFGQAMALVRLERYPEAVERLRTAARTYPDQPGFPHALARVLAAAPDDGVRDGPQALALLEPLVTADPPYTFSETMAMAMAEVGRFDDAVTWQRRAVVTATDAGATGVAARLTDNLSRYERREPSRTPWPDDDPVHHPFSQISAP